MGNETDIHKLIADVLEHDKRATPAWEHDLAHPGVQSMSMEEMDRWVQAARDAATLYRAAAPQLATALRDALDRRQPHALAGSRPQMTRLDWGRDIKPDNIRAMAEETAWQDEHCSDRTPTPHAGDLARFALAVLDALDDFKSDDEPRRGVAESIEMSIERNLSRDADLREKRRDPVDGR